MSKENNENDKNKHGKLIRYGLVGVGCISIGSALLHAFFPNRFDEKTAMFLIVAIVALVIDQITKFKGFGIEIEKRVNQLEDEVKGVGGAIDKLEKGVGPGSKTASIFTIPPVDSLPLTDSAIHTKDAQLIVTNDPNKGQFGGLSEANGRKLTATIKPDAGPKSSLCKVFVKIESTDSEHPLTGKVKLHLHPTFGNWSCYELESKGGIAKDEFVSYGAFTIGAEADNGKTRLELDLIDVPGGTDRFYEE